MDRVCGLASHLGPTVSAKAVVANYRLYFLDPTGKRFLALREFEAATDGLAVALSEDARGSDGMELWTGNRKVRTWRAAGNDRASLMREPG